MDAEIVFLVQGMGHGLGGRSQTEVHRGAVLHQSDRQVGQLFGRLVFDQVICT